MLFFYVHAWKIIIPALFQDQQVIDTQLLLSIGADFSRKKNVERKLHSLIKKAFFDEI